MATVQRFVLGLVAVLVCIVSAQAYVIRDRGDVNEMATSRADGSDMMTLAEMMTAKEEAEVDGMFPDQMRDDLKLELILKALEILKDYEGESVPTSVTKWLPSYDVMPEELKLRLILKAIIILKDRPLNATFAGHSVGCLELTLILKGLLIVEESKTDFSLAVDKGDLKLALILTGIDVLEVFDGECKDTVFFTNSKKELKLALILKAIALLKQGNWPIDIDDLWPMEGEDGDTGSEGTQSEASTHEATTTSEQSTVSEAATEVVTDEAKTTVTVEATSERTEGGTSNQPEASTHEATTTNEQSTVTEAATQVATDEAKTTVEATSERAAGETTAVETSSEPAEVTEPAVVPDRGDVPDHKKHWLHQAVGKVFKFFTWLPRAIIRKKLHISH
ncbi:uncharacterized protein LOC119726341 [Patiria miniata]|uniref:Uncharacterized protein n=1 Tax=Patiria miniata TaxID=46514 RepID=A0A913ZRX9_PATMI|nr:uncharacterized protein LOC119726341 [Patiria miniata]